MTRASWFSFVVPCPLSLVPCPLSLVPCPLSLVPCPCPSSIVHRPSSIVHHPFHKHLTYPFHITSRNQKVYRSLSIKRWKKRRNHVFGSNWHIYCSQD